MDDVITPTIENDEVELLIIASIQTLKRKKKRCGRDEVFQLVSKISKCNDIIKSNQELSKNNVKPLENKTLIKQDRFIETTTTTNKESKKLGKKMN